jgi:hypothetical protein
VESVEFNGRLNKYDDDASDTGYFDKKFSKFFSVPPGKYFYSTRLSY